MVWACGKNGLVPYGQKGVDGRSQWRTGKRETELRLDGWCEGGLGQQRNDGGGSASMRERSTKEYRSLVHMQLNEFHSARFAWHCVLSDRPPVLWWLSNGEGRDAVT